MGLFGGSSKSTSNNYNTTNTSEVNQQEGLLNLGKGSQIEGGVNISNGVVESNEAMQAVSEKALEVNSKALSDSFDFGVTAIEQNGKVVSQGFDFAESLVNQQTANSNNATLAIKDLAKSISDGGASEESAQLTKRLYAGGAVVIVVVLGVVLMVRSRKK